MDVFDSCYILLNYYTSLKKESYEKSDGFIDDDDNDENDHDAVGGDVNNPGVIMDVELEIQNAQYTHKKAARHFITFAKNPSRCFEGKIQKSNNPYKSTTVIHRHGLFYSDHGHVLEYSFD